jgi:ABC-type phosphate transport system substrate-binding protein
MARNRRARRSVAAVALAVVGVAGLTLASAAKLTTGSASLGAGTSVVASCEPAGQAISIGLTISFSTGLYRATEVRLSNVNATCAGQTYQIQLVGTNGLALNPELSATVTLTGGVLTVPIPSTPASNIGGVAVVIHN